MHHRFLLAASLVCFAVPAAAQCASLSITGSGAPGTTLTATIDGSTAGAFAFLAVGDTTGTTTIPFGPLGTLTLGLAFPFIPVPMGQTDANGDATLVIDVPPGLPFGLDLFGQGVTVAIGLPAPPPAPPGITLTFCATNVVAFHVGV